MGLHAVERVCGLLLLCTARTVPVASRLVLVCLQGAMKATFKAMNASPVPALAPVNASFLAQRRGKARGDKASTEV